MPDPGTPYGDPAVPDPAGAFRAQRPEIGPAPHLGWIPGYYANPLSGPPADSGRAVTPAVLAPVIRVLQELGYDTCRHCARLIEQVPGGDGEDGEDGGDWTLLGNPAGFCCVPAGRDNDHSHQPAPRTTVTITQHPSHLHLATTTRLAAGMRRYLAGPGNSTNDQGDVK